MTNAQLYLSIAIPSVLVILSWVLVALSWMQQDKRLARIEATLDSSAREARGDIKDVRSELMDLRS